MEKKKLLRPVLIGVYILIGFTVLIGCLYYQQYQYKHNTMKEVSLQPLENKTEEVIGMYDEISTDVSKRLIIYPNNRYDILKKDGSNPEENTLIEQGAYQMVDDRFEIKKEGSTIPYTLTLETPSDGRFTLLKIRNEEENFFIGTKISDETEQKQTVIERETVPYYAPGGA